MSSLVSATEITAYNASLSQHSEFGHLSETEAKVQDQSLKKNLLQKREISNAVKSIASVYKSKKITLNINAQTLEIHDEELDE